jgi:hypothetical protein
MLFDSETGEYYANEAVLDMEPRLEEIFDYLGLGRIPQDEGKLIARINIDNMPVRVKSKILDNSHLIVQGQSYLICFIELKTRARMASLFDNNIKEVPTNIYKVSSIKLNLTSNEVDISSKDIQITKNDMFAIRDELITYYSEVKTLEHPLTPNKQRSNSTKKNIDGTTQTIRLNSFNKFCIARAKEKKLPNQEHQTIYDSFSPPMTKNDFYKELFTFESKIFNANGHDFFRDSRVLITFKKSARNR